MSTTSYRARALELHQSGELTDALEAYAQHLAAQPDDYVMWSNLGALYRSQKNFEHSVTAHRRALQGPHSAQILGNASNALFDAGYASQAVDLRRALIELEPDVAMHHAMLGKYLRGAGDYQGAKQALEHAIAAHPEFAELHIQIALAHLSLGDYPRGFESFDWRWKGDEISKPKLGLHQWRGEDLSGKKLLVYPEQGFGDTVLMARFLGQVSDRGAQVILICKTPLLRVFQNMQGIAQLVEMNNEAALKQARSDADYWVPMMDLPLYLGTKLDTVPAPAQLHIPQDSIDRASALTHAFATKLKIGVLWSGSLTYRANHKRSFDHTRFLPLAQVPNVQLFSLYKGPMHDAFVADGSHVIILDAAGNDRDFADSAALIQQLDLVITMDSAIAHVAGSLGVPVWNLLHSEAYWLYEPFPDHTPWYPTMRLIRQDHSGDWDGVFNQLRAEITDLSKNRTLP